MAIQHTDWLMTMLDSELVAQTRHLRSGKPEPPRGEHTNRNEPFHPRARLTHYLDQNAESGETHWIGTIRRP